MPIDQRFDAAAARPAAPAGVPYAQLLRGQAAHADIFMPSEQALSPAEAGTDRVCRYRRRIRLTM